MNKPDKIEPKHCDEYIDDPSTLMPLRWFLFINRLPASEKHMCNINGVNPQLYADCFGKRVRVVMASRMGDLGVTSNLNKEHGYELRVFVEELSNFSNKP
jgi:hypothetical protein